MALRRRIRRLGRKRGGSIQVWPIRLNCMGTRSLNQRGAGDSFDGSLPAACGRDFDAGFDEAPYRRIEDDVADGGERIDSERDVASGGAIYSAFVAAAKQVSVRQLSVILETLGDRTQRGRRIRFCLTEYVRHRCTGRGRFARGIAMPRASCTWWRLIRHWKTRFAAGFGARTRSVGCLFDSRPQSVESICQRGERRDRQADDARAYADRAGEPADSRGGKANHGEPPASTGGDEFQRSDAGYEDCHFGDGHG